MKDEQTFLQAILDHPEDAQLRLVFADWLEERGDPRSELLRVQHQLNQDAPGPQRQLLEDRLRSLLAAGVAPVGPFITNSLGMRFALIPAGKFLMGSPEDDPDHGVNEQVHPVHITRPFFLGIHTVTLGQFRVFATSARSKTEAEKGGRGGGGFNEQTSKFDTGDQYTWQAPGWEQSDQHPVVHVNWNGAVAFCDWLSQQEGKTYRLPTEAEWEYACRAQTTTRFYSGDDKNSLKDVANIADASFKRKCPSASYVKAQDWDNGYPFSAPVGQFQPNGFGLYDVHGNVWEWCADWFLSYPGEPEQDPQGPSVGLGRVVRGGSFICGSEACRSAERNCYIPSDRDFNVGFRVLLVR